MTRRLDIPDEVFAALADPTRARIVGWLDEGRTGTATAFAARLPMSRQAVSRHLKELERAGLIVGKKYGREVRYQLRTERLLETAAWLQARADRWEKSLARLSEYLEGLSRSDVTVDRGDSHADTPTPKPEPTEGEPGDPMADYEVTHVKTLGVPAEVAFAAFTETEQLINWFTTDAQADLRPGGKYHNADGDEGQFLIVDPPSHLRFTWDNPDHSPGTVVDIRVTSFGSDESIIRLVHHGLETKHHHDDLNDGWSWALDSFKSYLETGEPVSYDVWIEEKNQ